MKDKQSYAHSDTFDHKNPDTVRQLQKKIERLERQLEQSRLSLSLLEQAKDRYDGIYNSTIQRLVDQKAELDKKNKALTEASKEIKTLRGIIPICSVCKKIRDDKGYWNRLEAYIQKHSHAEFSHGICRPCARELYPDVRFKDRKKKGD